MSRSLVTSNKTTVGIPGLLLAVVSALFVLAPYRQVQPDAAGGPTQGNIALHKPCTLSPLPNYPLTAKVKTGEQLTDGIYTQGYFWTQKSTIGWENTARVFLTVDLGRNEPIGGASLDTAAGYAGVEFPAAIVVSVSTDDKTYRPLGDLIEASNSDNGAPASRGYLVHRFRTDRWKGYGRWVTFMVVPKGPYFFTDEIEIYRGHSPNGRSLSSLSVSGRRGLLETYGVWHRLRSDQQTVDALAGKPSSLPLSMPDIVGNGDRSRDVLPLGAVHRQVFKEQAALWRDRGLRRMDAWVPASPYDPLPYLTDAPRPTSPSRSDSIVLLRGETRPVAIDLLNPTPGVLAVTIRIHDLKGPAGIIRTHLYRTIWTDRLDGGPVATALSELHAAAGRSQITLDAGMTEQLWITLGAERSGDVALQVSLSSEHNKSINIPVYVSVLPLALPRDRSFHLGGWDYTDRVGLYGVTRENRKPLIAFLRRYGVDIPWAESSAMPLGRYDAAGRMISEPDTSVFNRWVNMWKGAWRYNVFLAVGPDFAGARAGTPDFERKVSSWAKFWRDHLRKIGLRPDQLALELVDEPHTSEQDRLIVAWAEAIREAYPEVRLWENPIWTDPHLMDVRVPKVCDILSPLRSEWIQSPKTFSDYYLPLRDDGKRLGLYSVGIGYGSDPYTIYRLQAWQCFSIGAREEHFWSFSGQSGESSWNAYTSPQQIYTPFFLDNKSVVTSKHMEAIRDGVEDYEILVLLQAATKRARKRDPGERELRDAEELLIGGVAHTLDSADMQNPMWDTVKDRSVADQVRLNAIRQLLTITHHFASPL